MNTLLTFGNKRKKNEKKWKLGLVIWQVNVAIGWSLIQLIQLESV